ncbi:MAG: ABC transporter permease [Firmicutes bacterium]|nr:ABC transporter permease [Bacillota bacterium]
MPNRLSGLLIKDIKTSIRGYFLLIVIIVALLLVGLINFVIPEDASVEAPIFYHLTENVSNKQLKLIIKDKDILNSKDEVIKKMKDNATSLGVILDEENNKPKIEIITQGYENEKIINTLKLAIKEELYFNPDEMENIRIIKLKPSSNKGKIPFNDKMVPLMVLLEPVLMGFVMIAALIFIEKEQGTIEAYRVSPGNLSEYIASKVIVMMLYGLLSTLIITIGTVGFSGNIVMLLILVSLGSIVASNVGLIIASFFNNISQALIPVVLTSIVITTPVMLAFFAPSFSPIYLKILPTYPLMFAIKEAIFPTGNTGLLLNTIGLFIVFSLVSYMITILSYKRNMIKK